ncbi:MAG: FKBP-type peptidyl-prolyl cis-trans isomerase [Pirellulales bacterium]
MKSSFFVLFLLAGASFAVGADQAGKKPAKPAKPAAADDAAETKPSNAKSDDKDPATDEHEKPAKKPAKPNGGLKLSPGGAKKRPDEKEVVKNLSNMLGISLGKQIAGFEELGIKIDLDVVIEAIKEGMTAEEPAMTDDERREASMAIQELLEEKMAAKNKREGEEFLENNKKEEGVKTLASGLQYKVMKSGKGESPKKTDTVRAHYQGSFLNGQVFDSSYRRGQPASFPLNNVLKGWAEALSLMKVGDKWQLFIPPELAYEESGKRDQQGNPIIPPNATLIFEVELLGVEKGSKLPSLK